MFTTRPTAGHPDFVSPETGHIYEPDGLMARGLLANTKATTKGSGEHRIQSEGYPTGPRGPRAAKARWNGGGTRARPPHENQTHTCASNEAGGGQSQRPTSNKWTCTEYASDTAEPQASSQQRNKRNPSGRKQHTCKGASTMAAPAQGDVAHRRAKRQTEGANSAILASLVLSMAGCGAKATVTGHMFRMRPPGRHLA